MYIIDSKNYKGYKINLCYDECADNPFECGTFVGTLWCNHRDYTHLDEDIEKLSDYAKDEEQSLEDYLENNYKMWFPIYAYEHGSIHISMSNRGQFSDRWDSGLFGIVTINDEQFKKYGGDEIQITRYVSSSIKELNGLLSGEVYLYNIINPAGDVIDDGICGGFLDYDECESEAIKAVDYDYEHIENNYEIIALRQPIEQVIETLSNQNVTKEQLIKAISENLSEEEIRKLLFEISKM